VAAFSRRVASFQDVFPSSSSSFAHASEVSEDVQLTHPFLAAGTRFLEFVIEVANGAAGVPVANHAVVPLDRYWYVPVWHVNHDDPAARVISWEMEHFDSTTSIVIESTRQQGASNPIGANTNLGLRRPVLIPPGFRAVGAVNTLAAGEFVNSTLIRVEYPLGENPPPF